MDYRSISAEEISPALFDGFHRHQIITDAWQREGDGWVIRPAPRLIEDWGPKQHDFICWCLNITLSEGGAVYGAFEGGKLKGIAAVSAQPFGSRVQYRELSFLQISEEYRGQGIGKALFALAKDAARRLGGKMLYISSQASVETQAFYRAMGCRDAAEPDADHVQQNPQERQLECDLLCRDA